MNPNPVDVSQIDLSKAAQKPFPPDRRYRLLISAKAHEAIHTHASQSAESQNEVGGVLVGNFYKDDQGPFLEITGAIVAEHTKNEGTQVTFTHETWNQVNRAREKHHPDEKIVGWYHTHPRFGVFLSDKDKFIQKSYFNLPWQTAFVVDPVQHTEGFFIWSEGEPKLIDEYWVGLERRDRSFAEVRHDDVESENQDETSAVPSAGPGTAVSRAAFALVVAVGFLALTLLAGYVYLREVSHTETEKYVLRALEVQQRNLESTLGELGALNDSLAKTDKRVTANEKEIDQRMNNMAHGLMLVRQQTIQLRERVETQQRVIDQLVRKATGAESGATESNPANGPQKMEK